MEQHHNSPKSKIASNSQAHPIKIRVKVKPSIRQEALTGPVTPSEPVTQLPPQQAAVQEDGQEFVLSVQGPEPAEAPQNILERPKPRRKWIPAVWVACGVIAVVAVVILLSLLLPKGVKQQDINSDKGVKQQDINSINGCPELFDIVFGMNVEAVSGKIEVGNHTLEGLPSDGDDPMIVINPGTEFGLYDMPVQNFLCSFDERALVMVLLMFEKEAVTYEQLTELYSQIYGPPTVNNTSETVWSGAKTTITVFADSEDDVFVVRYKESPNQRFGELTFHGPELDPCGFLTDNYAFDKTASHYIAGLQKDKDYDVEEFSAAGFAGFSKYTLYPDYTYMGIEEGYTAISLDIDAEKKTVDVVSYLFHLNQQNAVDRLDYVKRKMDAVYGDFVDCSYTSLYYSDMGVKELTFGEARTKIKAGTQGIYHIQWKDDRYRATFGLTISTDSTVYEGYVAYAVQPSHEHDYALKTDSAPTCIENGEKVYACECGASYTEAVKTTGHSFSGPTCVEPAICAFCGAASETVGHHTYTASVTAPTCTAKGYTRYTCFCGDSYEDNQTAMIPHTFENYKCTVCSTVDKAKAAKYLEYWLKQNGEYDSSTPCYYYIDLYENNALAYALAFTVSGNTIYVERSNIEQGVDGYTALIFSNGAYITQFGNACIEGAISKASFNGTSPIPHTSYIGPEDARSLMSDLARASIADTLDWLAWFLAAHNVGITLADLGFVSYY